MSRRAAVAAGRAAGWFFGQCGAFPTPEHLFSALAPGPGTSLPDFRHRKRTGAANSASRPRSDSVFTPKPSEFADFLPFGGMPASVADSLISVVSSS